MKFLDSDGLSILWARIKDVFQVKLVSGTNIKTVNGSSLLGSGNISVSSGSAEVSGTITVDAINVGEDTEDQDYGVTIGPDNGIHVQEPSESAVYTNVKPGYIQLTGNNVDTTGSGTSTEKYIDAGGSVTKDSDGNITCFDAFASDGSLQTIEAIDDATINALS